MELVGTNIGPFRLVRLLGKGGMGRVYLAEHTLMKDLHAIKVLDPVLTQDPQLVARFINEARAAARVRHRNLIRVHNIDCVPDGPWFMVLDFLDGETLAQFLAGQRGPLAPSSIVHILAQVASCIQHVHDHGIVHRDLKPDNIFLIRNGDDRSFPVVLDLGIAQLSRDLASGPQTRTGTLIGTPGYMSPEQLRGERVSPAADVFALGVIAYELTTGGCLPYQRGESRAEYFGLPATELHDRQCGGPPLDPRLHVAGLGAAWVEALSRPLASHPRARPPSARAFALMLAEAVTAGPDGIDGHAIVCSVARELLERSDADDAIRPSAATIPLAPVGDQPCAAPAMQAAPITTLAGAASQSMMRPRAGLRWRLAATGAAAVLIASGGSVLTLTHVVAPQSVQPTGVVAPSPLPVDAPPIAGGSAHHDAPAPDHPAAHHDAPAADDTAARHNAPPAREEASRRAPVASLPRGGSGPTAVARKGELVILVRPWAMIWLNGQELGQTPFRNTVAAGKYSLRIANDNLGIDETTTITVIPDRSTKIERSW
ncbi:MAG TPA: protein kinase [Kofleriaceae bacterium]|jgi:serine/threonine protein kinase|nr:protein kinase [Kofleriaceae bacterium]